jgi:hypothetical protein
LGAATDELLRFISGFLRRRIRDCASKNKPEAGHTGKTGRNGDGRQFVTFVCDRLSLLSMCGLPILGIPVVHTALLGPRWFRVLALGMGLAFP